MAVLHEMKAGVGFANARRGRRRDVLARAGLFALPALLLMAMAELLLLFIKEPGS